MEILSDGEMYPYGNYISIKDSMGNAFDDSWENIWTNSPSLNQMRNIKNGPCVCKRYNFDKFCKGGFSCYIKYF